MTINFGRMSRLESHFGPGCRCFLTFCVIHLQKINECIWKNRTSDRCAASISKLCFGHQVLLHVWAKIAPRVRFSPLPDILYVSPSKIDERFCYIRTSGSLVGFCSPFAWSTCKKQWMFLLKSHFWPAWRLHPLLMVSDPRIIAFWCLQDTYFTSFSRLRSAFEKNTYFTILSRPCVACANGANRPEGRFSQTHWLFFQSEREAARCFFDLQRS